jgi:DNA-binding GntR family transcriptional regulator
MTLWQDIATTLREEIVRGVYPPDSTIPKETALMARHRVGRETIRRAIAQLVAEGLVEPVRRRGTVVRNRPARRRITRSRQVYRDEIGYFFDHTAQGWRPLQTPTVSRGPVPYDVASLLGVEPGAEVTIRDRVMGDPDTQQVKQLATSYIPVEIVTQFPILGQANTGPGGIYDRLEEGGQGPIEWREAISARMPTPTEARLMRLPAGVPVLRIVRLATSPSGRPLEVNETRLNAEEWEVGYPIAREVSAQA